MNTLQRLGAGGSIVAIVIAGLALLIDATRVTGWSIVAMLLFMLVFAAGRMKG